MSPQDHITLAKRFEASTRKLGPEHYEHIIEGAMMCGTHWLNAAMHQAGLSDDKADVMHAEFLSLGLFEKVELRFPGLAEALLEMEHLRAPFVRGNAPDGREAGLRALALLDDIKRAAQTD